VTASRRHGRLRRAALAALALLAAPAVRAAEPAPVTLDVLFLYTPGVAVRYGSATDTRLQHLLDAANDVFRTSESGIRLRLVHTAQVAYSDTASSDRALDDVTYNRGPFAGLEAQRARRGADLVVLLRPYANDGVCGVAWIGGYDTQGDLRGSARYAYSHVSADCGDDVLPHEIGHNLGLTHSRRQDGRGGTWPFSLGHGVDFRFATVMAYPAAFAAPRLPVFSHPGLTCSGLPCGVDRRDASAGADAAWTLQQVRGQVAAYQPAASSAPPAPTDHVDLLSPAPGDVLRAGQSVTVSFSQDGNVASVDVFYRKEVGRKRKAWRLLASGVTEGTGVAFTVPPGFARQRAKVRFLAVGRDASGDELTRALSGPFRVPRR
jgi:hypothetical protein